MKRNVTLWKTQQTISKKNRYKNRQELKLRNGDFITDLASTTLSKN